MISVARAQLQGFT